MSCTVLCSERSPPGCSKEEHVGRCLHHAGGSPQPDREHGIPGFDVRRGYASRKGPRVDCWNHNSRCSGCCQEAFLSEIEYGSLWKPFNSTLPRLPMNPRSIFLAGEIKAFLGPLLGALLGALERRCRGW